MTILSDSEIIELCTMPTFMIRRTQLKPFFGYDNGGYIPTHDSEEKLQAIIEREKYTNAGVNGALYLDYRALTEQEKESFQPMLSPFVPSAVRAVEVKASSETDSYSARQDSDDIADFMNGTMMFKGEFSSDEVKRLRKNKVISFGVSSYGYDCRLSREIKIFTNLNAGIIDPKRLNPETLIDGKINTDETGAEYVILPPNSYLLGCTVETFSMPRDVISICLGKSSYARAGIGINVTPIEPGFVGEVVIEISNMTSLPVKIYVNEGIAQFLFFRGSKSCAVSYADRSGKYMYQNGVTLPRV